MLEPFTTTKTDKNYFLHRLKGNDEFLSYYLLPSDYLCLYCVYSLLMLRMRRKQKMINDHLVVSFVSLCSSFFGLYLSINGNDSLWFRCYLCMTTRMKIFFCEIVGCAFNRRESGMIKLELLNYCQFYG